MKYGLLTYSEDSKKFNIGDYIQSLAARQFLPQIDSYINREKLAQFKGDKTKIILNGWFTHNAKNWIPGDDLIPLFISFHINNSAAPLMLSERGKNYLKRYEPIGCRDYYTVSLLKENGIDAYFSGCLTLTLDSYRVGESERNDKIYVVDVLYGYQTVEKVFYNYRSLLRSILNGSIFSLGKQKKHINNFIDNDLFKYANHETQVLPSFTYSETEKFVLAEKLLNKYARAKLVITSRIHCALPCLALGTPVIYVNGFESFIDSCRLEGILNLFNRLDVNIKTGEFRANFNIDGKISKDTNIINPDNYINLADGLKRKSRDFIESGS